MGETIHNRDPGESGLTVHHAPDGRDTNCHAVSVSLQATSGRASAVNAYSENPDAPAVRAQGPGPVFQGYDADGELVFEVDETGITVGGAAGTPSGTVAAETSYGLSSSAGASSNYSRGDHTHGTPALPSAADVGALAVANNLSDVASASTARTNLGAAATSHSHAGGDITSGTVAYARLPVGTSSSTVAAGDDSRITGAVQASTVDAKGDLLAASAADTVARLAVGSDGQALVAQSGATAGLAYVNPHAFHTSPLTHYGLLAASGDPVTFLANTGITNGQLFLVRVWIPAGVAITNLWVAVRSGGTHDGATNPNQLALYNDSGTQLDTTANDATLFTAAGWRGGALSGGAQAAQSTGRWVYIGHIARGMTGGSIAFPSGVDDNQATWFSRGPGGGNRRAMYQTGQTALPASFNPTSHGTATTFVPLYGVT